MNKDQYLRMVEQTGEEIDWDRIPADIEDFPDSVLTALNIYYTLGSRVYPEIGYIGKDYTLLPLLLNDYKIETHNEKSWILELLICIDSHTISESQKSLKAEYAKMKRK